MGHVAPRDVVGRRVVNGCRTSHRTRFEGPRAERSCREGLRGAVASRPKDARVRKAPCREAAVAPVPLLFLRRRPPRDASLSARGPPHHLPPRRPPQPPFSRRLVHSRAGTVAHARRNASFSPISPRSGK